MDSASLHCLSLVPFTYVRYIGLTPASPGYSFQSGHWIAMICIWVLWKAELCSWFSAQTAQPRVSRKYQQVKHWESPETDSDLRRRRFLIPLTWSHSSQILGTSAKCWNAQGGRADNLSLPPNGPEGGMPSSFLGGHSHFSALHLFWPLPLVPHKAASVHIPLGLHSTCSTLAPLNCEPWRLVHFVSSKRTRCYGLNICVPSKFICWNPNA